MYIVVNSFKIVNGLEFTKKLKNAYIDLSIGKQLYEYNLQVSQRTCDNEEYIFNWTKLEAFTEPLVRL